MFAAETKGVTAPVRPDAGTAVVNTWKQLIDPVEPFLEAVNRRLVQQVETFDPELVPYADYALNGQGKHLRPALVALAANALGKPRDAHVSVAVIIEVERFETARAFYIACHEKRKRPGKTVDGLQQALSKLPVQVLRIVAAGVRRQILLRLSDRLVTFGWIVLGCDG